MDDRETQGEVERAARSLLGWPFSLLVAGISAAMVATWLPHYLLWPWWPDLDTWATIAQGWDSGIRPYRDVVIFNFPGQIYGAYGLGKLFGWGRTWPVFALDAALLLTLGGLLASWSRRCLGRTLPGLVGFAAVLSAYLNLDYTYAAQRDWQGPLLALAGLLIVQRWPGPKGRLAASALLAMGFAIRPHVVLFGPPIALAIYLQRPEAEPRSATARRFAIWAALSLLMVALAFSPLIWQGLMGDFVRGVRQASYGSRYSQTTRKSLGMGLLHGLSLDRLDRPFRLRGPALANELWERLEGWKTLATIALLILIARTAPDRVRRVAWPWVAALGFALLYRPLHPKPHLYLVLPLRLTWACSLPLLVDGLLRTTARRPILGLAGTLILLGVAVPGVPSFCSVTESLDALREWKRSDEPELLPRTASAQFHPGRPESPFTWPDYRRTLIYLRSRTSPATPVANLLNNVPFPAINGPIGRISPLPAESGLIWIWSVDPTQEDAFVKALERSPAGTVVVWSPGTPTFDKRLQIPKLSEAVRRMFRPEARFGPIEVWRKPGG